MKNGLFQQFDAEDAIRKRIEQINTQLLLKAEENEPIYVLSFSIVEVLFISLDLVIIYCRYKSVVTKIIALHIKNLVLLILKLN